jgi:anti-anti-sigma regulatory factor
VSKKKPPRRAGKSPKRPASPQPPECIQLDARMTIVQAAGLHATLLARLAHGGPVEVDGTRVEEIDTAILQLLTSLWRTGRERGFACSWTGASDALRRMAGLVGVAEMLRFPESGSARERGNDAART